MKIVVRILGAILLGYFAMILLLVLTQDLTLGRVEIGVTPFWKIFLVGIGAFISALVGGWVAAKIYAHQKLLPQMVIAIWTIVEAILVVQTGKSQNPIWFEVLAEGTLFFGILLGGWIGLQNKSYSQKLNSEVG